MPGSLSNIVPYFVEDPLRVENSQSYRQLRARTTVPLAAGEQYNSKWEFRQVVEEELIDYARVDLCICAGLTEAKKIAAMCETHYIDLAVHNPIGPVAGIGFPASEPVRRRTCAVQELPKPTGREPARYGAESAGMGGRLPAAADRRPDWALNSIPRRSASIPTAWASGCICAGRTAPSRIGRISDYGTVI